MMDHTRAWPRRAHRHLILIAALTLCAAGAWADGVIDFVIDPATGHSISAPGSYRLADSVTMSAEVTAIDVTASDVTIDLGGHTITGPGAINTAGVHGIDLNTVTRVTVVNGTIQNYLEGTASPNGIEGTSAAGLWVRDVRIDGGGIGITLGDRSRAERCAVMNGRGGIRIDGDLCVVQDCQLINNTIASGIGFSGSADHNLVRDNYCAGNQTGITTTGGGSNNVFVGNVCVNNSLNGIRDFSSVGNFFDNHAVGNTSADYFGVSSVTSQAASNERGDNLTP